MYYKQKPKHYPGRGIVRAIEAVLVIAIMLVVADALVDRFTPDTLPTRSYSNVTAVELNTNPPTVEAVPVQPESVLGVADYFNMALDYHMRDDYFAAIDYYTQAIEADDSYPAPWLNRGVAYEQTNQRYRATHDLWTYVQKNADLTLTRLGYTMGETVDVEMAQGRVYRFPFTAQTGDQIVVSAIGDPNDIVDPMIVILDKYNRPVASNDDMIVNGQFQSMNSYIGGFTVPYNCQNDTQQYTLVVHHAGGGQYGAQAAFGTVSVSLDVID